MRTLAIAISLIGLALFAAYTLGDNDGSAAQLATERTERTRIETQAATERTAIEQAERTQRTAIDAQALMWLATERESTLRLIVVAIAAVAVAVAVLAILLAVGILVGRTLHTRREQDDRTYLLAMHHQLPSGWRVTNDPAFGWIATNGDEYMLAHDVRALLEVRKS